MTPVRLEPAALRSRVKRSTTEPLRSHPVAEAAVNCQGYFVFVPCGLLFVVVFNICIGFVFGPCFVIEFLKLYQVLQLNR